MFFTRGCIKLVIVIVGTIGIGGICAFAIGAGAIGSRNLTSRNAQYRQHLAIQDLAHLARERQTRLRWLLEVEGLVANECVRLPPDRQRPFKW